MHFDLTCYVYIGFPSFWFSSTPEPRCWLSFLTLPDRNIVLIHFLCKVLALYHHRISWSIRPWMDPLLLSRIYVSDTLIDNFCLVWSPLAFTWKLVFLKTTTLFEVSFSANLDITEPLSWLFHRNCLFSVPFFTGFPWRLFLGCW